MKKSEIYHILQKLVLSDSSRFNSYDEKLTVLRELFGQEDLAKMMEEMEKKNAEANQE